MNDHYQFTKCIYCGSMIERDKRVKAATCHECKTHIRRKRADSRYDFDLPIVATADP